MTNNATHTDPDTIEQRFYAYADFESEWPGRGAWAQAVIYANRLREMLGINHPVVKQVMRDKEQYERDLIESGNKDVICDKH